MKKLVAGLAVGIGLLVVSDPAFSHHGGQNYDQTHLITLKGTVTEVELINPHALIHFEAKDDQGNVEKWVGDLPSPNGLRRNGWNSHTVKAGDQFSFIGNRFKDGSKKMAIRKLLMPDGQELKIGGQQE